MDYYKQKVKSREDSEFIAGICALLFVVVITLAILQVWFSTPIVYWSASKDRCVKVENCDCTCDSLPEKYERVWVE